MSHQSTSRAKKTSVLVVKSLRDLSPKRQFLVSRAAAEEEDEEELEPSTIQNQSPKRPEVDKKSFRLLPRSILGDPASFERLEKRSSRAAAVQHEAGSGRTSPPLSQSRAPLTRGNSNRSFASRSSPTSPKDATNNNDDDGQAQTGSHGQEKTPAAYVEWLKTQQATAAKIYKHNQNKERALEKFLGPEEQNKDSKVLALWQQRQSDWDKIQATISRQLKAGPGHSLMMTTADEYRCKREEYDLIMAAVPAEDRFGDKAWQTLLRGGGPTLVAIGHLFSGIECEVDKPPVEPIMVRKPRPAKMSKTGAPKPLVDESPALLDKRRKLAKNIEAMRPHNMTLDNACQLVVKSSNLFQWAIDSSTASFKGVDAAAATWGDSPSAQASPVQLSSIGEKHFDDDAGAAEKSLVARLGVPEASEVIFTARRNQTVTQKFAFTNTGSVALSYLWSAHKADEHSTPEAALMQSSGVNKLLTARAELPREHLLSRQRVSFFCAQSSGKILPGETVQSIFSFVSKGGGGVAKQCWKLETTPACAIVGADPSISLESASGSVTITLRGHAVDDEVEQHAGLRKGLRDEMDAQAKESIAIDVISQCLRRLRLPVRRVDHSRRCVDLFLRKNRPLLDGLCPGYAAVEFCVTMDRLAQMQDLHLRVTVYRKAMDATRRALGCRERDADPAAEAEVEAAAAAASALDAEDLPACEALRAVLFPEGLVEVFDEVTEEMLVPKWCFDMALLQDRCRAELDGVEAIEALEVALTKRDAQRAKEQRRAAKKGTDDDDEEEEEEEEEEEADPDAPPPPRHALFIQGSALLSECSGSLLNLLTRPLPSADMHLIARDLVTALADDIVDMEAQARERAGLAAHPEPVPSMPQPYLAEETMTAWAAAIEASANAAVKSVAPPAKGAPAASAPTTGGSDAFYGQLYTKLHGALAAAAEDMFARVDAKLYRDRALELNEFAARMASLASVRREDLAPTGQARKVAFVAFDGAVYTGAYRPASAFDLVAAGQAAAMETLVQLGNAGVGAVVLVYDSADAASNAFAAVAQPAVQTFLTECLARTTAANSKAAAKNARLAKKVKKIGAEAVSAGMLALVPAVEYVVETCASVAELTVRLEQHNQQQLQEQEQQGAQGTLVLILEDLSLPGVVPPEPPLPELEEEDDDAPIPIGQQDFTQYRAEQWVKARPHLVSVPTSSGATLGVYADAPAALQALFSAHDSVWIDAAVDGFGQTRSALCQVRLPRMVTQEIRDGAVWAAVLASAPSAGVLLADLTRHEKEVAEAAESAAATAVQEAQEGQEGLAEAMPEVPEPRPVSSPQLASHLAALFPAQLAEARAAASPLVKLCAVIGGECRADKFRVLDHVLEMVSDASFCLCIRLCAFLLVLRFLIMPTPPFPPLPPSFSPFLVLDGGPDGRAGCAVPLGRAAAGLSRLRHSVALRARGGLHSGPRQGQGHRRAPPAGRRHERRPPATRGQGQRRELGGGSRCTRRGRRV